VIYELRPGFAAERYIELVFPIYAVQTVEGRAVQLDLDLPSDENCGSLRKLTCQFEVR